MSRKVYIVGGGYSVNFINLNLLKNRTTIVTNKALFCVPNPDYFITLDYTFLKKINLDEFRRKEVSKFFVVNFGSGVLEEKGGKIRDIKSNIVYNLSPFDVIIKSYKSEGIGFSFRDFRSGDNSGLSAFQLAVILGFKEIYLIGIDLKIFEDKTHFHEGYGTPRYKFRERLRRYYEYWKKAILELKEKRPDIKVYSLSPISRLNDLIPYKEDLQMDIKKIKFITFHTGGLYEELVYNCFIPSCERFGLDYEVFYKENTHDWNKNTRYKAKVILEALEKYPDKDIVFIDADAVIHTFPSLFYEIPKKYDIAVHYLDWYKFWRNIEGETKRELLTGTMFFRNNSKVKKLIKEWIEANEKDPYSLEQRVLQKLLSKKPEIKIYELPIEYIAFRKQNGEFPPFLKNKDIVIEHFQASREIRRGRVIL